MNESEALARRRSLFVWQTLVPYGFAILVVFGLSLTIVFWQLQSMLIDRLAETTGRVEEAKRYFNAIDNRVEITAAQIKAIDPLKENVVLNSKLLASFEDGLTALKAADAQLTAAEETLPTPEGAYPIIKVFYATDRDGSSHGENSIYGAGRGERTRYGLCQISIPKRHKMGRLESPWSFFRWKGKPTSKRHIVLQHTTEFASENFYSQLRLGVKSAATPELFIFVHGFANSFVDAARRTAQLSYDLGFSGVPVMYSWPSKGDVSESDYRYDETNVEWTIPHLAAFLQEVTNNSGAEHINLVAHSMGNKILGNAIASLSADLRRNGMPTFNDVVLTAPDVDVDVFRDQLVPAMKRHSKRLTLYASSNDRALAFSKLIHGGYPRAGDTEPEILIASGLDSVDVSAVDTYFFSSGHSYFGTNRTIVSDLSLLLRGLSPAQRNLLPRPATTPEFWLFRP